MVTVQFPIIGGASEDLPQPHEMKEAGTIRHQLASICSELPGLDSNQDKENQNPPVPFRKPLSSKQIERSHIAGRSAGRSGHRENEGGITDPDLAALINAWPNLSDHIKAAIRALLAVEPKDVRRERRSAGV